ncbi:hypothetical protein H696_03156 [Fonticula alba]|uniref:Flavodoxin-like domain-containing protein n=1 Tax=Fonticula alba TaxID=691883 RepID=A0A058Z955_FONAL|nr:hypothetical protein H696_03156 [Fonticula alba]KCV70805.1 hypothetical protein H696_03156 [Fonticula alba]|eukprot:XP_009495321.1 hypothetical protein H696_03156 [Fonticula alba]
MTADPRTPPPNAALYVWYASQSGNAESIARGLAAEATSLGYQVTTSSLDDSPLVRSNAESSRHLAVIVCSTTGDGEVPDNGNRFYRNLRKRTHGPAAFSQLTYGLLCLGDTNYDSFCGGGRRLKKGLDRLGAVELCPIGLADEVTGLETVMDPWVANMWPRLAEAARAALPPGWSEDELKSGTEAAAQPDAASAAAVTTPEVASPDTVAAPMTGTFTCDIPAGTMGVAVVPPIDPALPGLPRPEDPVLTEQEHDAWAAKLGLPRLAVPRSVAISVGRAPRLSALRLHPTIAGGAPADGAPIRWRHLELGTMIPVAARVATAPGAVRTTIELALRIGDGFGGFEATGEPRHAPALETGNDAHLSRWRGGDAMGIIAPNDRSLVLALCQRLGVDPREQFQLVAPSQASAPAEELAAAENPLPHVPSPATAHDMLSFGPELREMPPKAAIRALAAEAPTGSYSQRILLFLSSRSGVALYNAWRADFRPTVLDLLALAPECRPPLARLLEILTPLTPRYYSVAGFGRSAEPNDRSVVRVLFNVLRDQTPAGAARAGLATTWLEGLLGGPGALAAGPFAEQPASLVEGPELGTEVRPGGALDASCDWSQLAGHDGQPLPMPELAAFLQPSLHFRLPPAGQERRPLVLVGPGTGVAPFLAFLQERMAALSSRGLLLNAGPDGAPVFGPIVMYAGCRGLDVDLLGADVLLKALKAGVLTRLSVSVSRQAGPPTGTLADAPAGSLLGTVHHLLAHPAVFVRYGAHVSHAISLDADILQPLLLGAGLSDDGGPDAARTYVCGDAAAMATGVRRAFAGVLAGVRTFADSLPAQETLEPLGPEDEASVAENLTAILQWTRRQRYVQDIWT